MFKACENNDIETVRKLLESGDIDLNIQNAMKETVLHIPAADNFIEIVKMLLEHGADLNIQEIDGMTPLHHASANGHCESVKVLLEYGADHSIRDYDLVLTIKFIHITFHSRQLHN